MERGASILARFGGIAGNWRMRSETVLMETRSFGNYHIWMFHDSLSERTSIRVQLRFTLLQASSLKFDANHNLAKTSSASSFLFHASRFAFFHISIRL
jgi:hypothetical protein